jgi:predicted ATPase/DNA-binding SARP family transcriptional activator
MRLELFDSVVAYLEVGTFRSEDDLADRWTIELFGGLRAAQGDNAITHFRSQKTGALLAYLAYFKNRVHSREALIELLWPDSDPEAGRNSFKTELSWLRGRLEPSKEVSGQVLISDRENARLNPANITTDVAEFEAALQSAMQATSDLERIPLLIHAINLYGGELLTGLDDPWIAGERSRLADSYIGALRRLVRSLAQTKEFEKAIDYARQAVAADPLREAAHRDLIQLYSAVGRLSAAIQQYQELKKILLERLNVAPSAATQALMERLRGSAPGPAQLPTFPATFTRFFGREQEIEELLSLLLPGKTLSSPSQSRSRLITLTGPGGSGKTRLATELATQVSEAFGGAVRFVALADLTDPGLISSALLNALGLARSTKTDPLMQISEMLNKQSYLLVLDNFEQLMEGGPAFVRTLLERCPSLICIVTSRQPVNIEGEREFPVRPLPIPAATETPEQLKLSASVQLFTDRAQAVKPSFQITEQNSTAVAALCAKLEGIPLAIELAAAWVGSLTPAEIRDRLEHRFDLLVSRRTDISPRHRTLRVAIEWSFRLLPPELREFFAQLSVFRGGWTLSTAEAVCDEPRALDYLDQLRERSLIVAEESGEETRFRMLETLREYAGEQLEEGERTAVSCRHADYFLRFVDEAEPHLRGEAQALWLERLEREHDNLRAALAWCLDDSDAASESRGMGLKLAAAMSRFWVIRGHLREGREQLENALAKAFRERWTVERANALHGVGTLAHWQGDYTAARAWYGESLAIRRDLGDRRGIAATTNALGLVLKHEGSYSASRKLFEEALSINAELGDRVGEAHNLGNLGSLACDEGNYVTARAQHEQALAISRELGNRMMQAGILNNLGIVTFSQGDYVAAHAQVEEAVAINRDLGNRMWVATNLQNLGKLRICIGKLDAAREPLEESLDIYRELGIPASIATSLAGLGVVAIRDRDYSTAKSLLDESLKIRRELTDKSGMAESLEYMASLATAKGEGERAARLFGAAEALREAIDVPISPSELEMYNDDVAALRALLNDSAFEAAWSAGRGKPWETAVAYALNEQMD